MVWLHFYKKYSHLVSNLSTLDWAVKAARWFTTGVNQCVCFRRHFHVTTDVMIQAPKFEASFRDFFIIHLQAVICNILPFHFTLLVNTFFHHYTLHSPESVLVFSYSM